MHWEHFLKIRKIKLRQLWIILYLIWSDRPKNICQMGPFKLWSTFKQKIEISGIWSLNWSGFLRNSGYLMNESIFSQYLYTENNVTNQEEGRNSLMKESMESMKWVSKIVDLKEIAMFLNPQEIKGITSDLIIYWARHELRSDCTVALGWYRLWNTHCVKTSSQPIPPFLKLKRCTNNAQNSSAP